MKIIIYILSIFICGNAYCKDFNLAVKDIQANEDINLQRSINIIEGLLQVESSGRRDFEDINHYKKRILKSKDKLKKHLEKRYITVLTPDKVELEWENSTVLIVVEMPSLVLRPRGRANPTREIKVIAYVPPKKARQIIAMKDIVEVEVLFQLDENKNMEVLELAVSFLGEKIYEE